MDSLARIISYVFHPLLMSTYVFIIFLFFIPAGLYPINPGSQILFLMLFGTITVVLPVVMMSFLKISGSINSFRLETRRERIFPFISILVLYMVFTYLLTIQNRLGLNDNVFKFILIFDALILIGTIITFFYKVSIHAIGIMGVVGILIPLNVQSDNAYLLWITIVMVALAGIVMSARLQLNAHTPRQVLTGGLSGFLIGFFGVILLF